MQIQSYSININKKDIENHILEILKNEFPKDYEKISTYDLWNIYEEYQKDWWNFWIALDENENIIWCIWLKIYSDQLAILKKLYVKKEYRWSWLAHILYDKLITLAKERKVKEIYLWTSQEMIAAQKFYTKQGFNNISTLPNQLKDILYWILFKLSLDTLWNQ